MMSKMSRKAELQTEENVTNSPLRRSSRISLSAVETTVKPVKTRRSSASSDNTDLQEKLETKPIRARRGSVTKEDPEKKSTILTRRRSSSVAEESQHDTPKSIRSRRTSNNEKSEGKGNNVKAENSKSTSSHRSHSVEVEKLELTGKSTVKTRRQSLDLEQNPPETKRVTRSRRSSVDISEETEPKTPKITKIKKTNSPLEPVIDKVPVVILTPVKKKPEQQLGDLNLSVIEELSFTEEKIPEETETSIHHTDDQQMADSCLKSGEKLTSPNRKSPRLNKNAKPSKNLEFTGNLKVRNLDLDVEGNKETRELIVNVVGKDNLDAANEISSRNSNSKTQIGKSIDSPTSSYSNLSNKDSVPEIEVTEKLPSKSESFKDILSPLTHTRTSTGCCIGEKNLNDSISKETLPLKNQSPNKIEVGEDSVGFSKTPNNIKEYSLSSIQQDSEVTVNLKDSEASPPITHKATEDDKEYILNTATGSANSDKENICNSDNLSKKDELNIISQGVRVQRVSNVFRPKQIDHSFVEPMEIDEQSMLNDTRNKPEDLDETNITPEKSGRQSVGDSIDESFNLCLNVTNAEQNPICRSRSQHELDESGRGDSPSEEKIDVEKFELSDENEEIIESVEEEIQEKTGGKLSVEKKLENDKDKVDASSDYEFHLETDEEDLNPEGVKDRKYIHSKCRDVSTEFSMTDKNTEQIEAGFEVISETRKNDINIEDCQDKLDQSFKADHGNNIEIGNVSQIQSIENISVSKTTHLYTTDIQTKEGKHIEPDKKSLSDITTVNQDVSDEKRYVGSSPLSQSEEGNNKKEIMKTCDLNTVGNSEENIEISEVIYNTGSDVQSNINKDITIIKNNIDIEDINHSDSVSNSKTIDNLAGEKSIENFRTNQILSRNSTCNTSEEPKSSNDSNIFNTKKEVDSITNLEHSNEQIILSAGESNQNCTEESKSQDAFVEIENNEMDTAEVISTECLKNIEVASPTLSKIKEHEMSTDFEYSKENFDDGNISAKLKNQMELDNSKNHNRSTEFGVEMTDGNLNISRGTTPKSDLNNPSEMNLHDSSTQLEMGNSFSEETTQDDTKSHSQSTNLDLNIGSMKEDEKLAVNHRDSAQLPLNTAESTKVISKDQNIEVDSKQGDINRRNSEFDLSLSDDKESNNKIVDSSELRKKAKQIKRNSVDEHSSVEIGDVSKSKLDAFLDKRLPEMCEGSDNNDDDFEETNEHNEFIDDMAEEGEEDTPSEDSNQIIDEGESINSTESEIDSDEDYDDNDSFICDEEEIELLSGEEYDLGQENVKKKKKSRIIDVGNYENEDVIQIKKKVTPKKGKERKSRIIDVEDCDDDVIIVEKVKIKNPETGKMPIINVEDSGDYTKEDKSVDETKMQHFEFTQAPNFSKAEETVIQKKPAYTKKSSIIVHENISVTSSTDATLSHRINSLVDSFCSKIQKGDISLNLSLEYDGESKTEDAVLKKNNSDSRTVDRDDKVMAGPPRKKRKLNSDLINDSNQRPNNFTGNIGRKRKKKHHHPERQLKKIKTKDLRTDTFSLMNQLITDVKNRPLRTVKPSTSKVDVNSSWIVDIVKITPSTSVVSKEEIDRYKRKKVHPKDFRQQMLYDPSRIQRMETKTLLKKRGAYK